MHDQGRFGPTGRFHHGATRTGRPSLRVLLAATIIAAASVAGPASAPAPAAGATATAGACANPAADVLIPAGASIDAFAQARPAGTSFRLAPGVFRHQEVTPKTNQRFYGTLGADCRRLTRLNGSLLLGPWQASGNAWVVAGIRPNVGLRDRRIECEPGHPRCAHPHDLFVDDRPLLHVSTRAAVGPGSWFFDYAANRVYLGQNPAGRTVELSYYEGAFFPRNPGVTVASMVVEKYASQPQYGAIGRHNGGAGWRIVDNEVRLNHGAGLTIGSGGVARANWIHDNGQVGAKLQGNGAVFEGNLVHDNNFARVYRSFEAGGAKGSGVGLRFIGNCVHDNDGSGLWADVGSSGAVFEGNTVFRNAYQGIFYEISSGGLIRNNVVGHNGERWPWLYGGQIMLGTARTTTITGNTVEVGTAYGNGITIVWSNRPPNNALDNRVTGNDVTFLARRGVSGLRTDFAGGEAIYSSSKFSNNRYHAPDPSFPHFEGAGNGDRNLAAQQRTGQEIGSTIDAYVRPRTWSCEALAAVRR